MGFGWFLTLLCLLCFRGSRSFSFKALQVVGGVHYQEGSRCLHDLSIAPTCRLIVESNALAAILLINKDVENLYKILNVIRDIEFLSSCIRNVSFKFCKRSDNELAHYLTQIAAIRVDDFGLIVPQILGASDAFWKVICCCLLWC